MQVRTQILNPQPTQLPLFINPTAGQAAALLAQLRQDQRLLIHELTPEQLKPALQTEIAKGTPRVLVCGGDGTLALAAASLAGTQTAMAVIAGGTLNHFAHNWKLPIEVDAAVNLAFTSPQVTAVDVGYVNQRLFLNTSSVGAYVHFVRIRELYETKMSYRLASLRAGFNSLLRLRSSHLYVDGVKLRSPLIFIGVRERDLSLSGLGTVHTAGQSALHVLILKTTTYGSIAKLIFNAMFRGREPVTQLDQVDSRLVEQLSVNNHHTKHSIYIALDGELSLAMTPLEYRYAANALLVVTPATQTQPCS